MVLTGDDTDTAPGYDDAHQNQSRVHGASVPGTGPATRWDYREYAFNTGAVDAEEEAPARPSGSRRRGRFLIVFLASDAASFITGSVRSV